MSELVKGFCVAGTLPLTLFLDRQSEHACRVSLDFWEHMMGGRAGKMVLRGRELDTRFGPAVRACVQGF